MGRRGHRRSASQDDDNVGCVWGLMRMLYFRRDPKLLLDAKQLSGRHTFREVSERGHSAKWPTDFDEIEDGNIEECTSQKPTVKNLMEDELGKAKLLKKNPNDEVQRRLADLGNDVSLDRSSEHTHKSTDNSYYQAGISMPSTPSMDSGILNYAEEYDLESVLVNFLGEIYSCHNECPHSDCKNRNELCPSLKSLIHKKVNELNNLPRNIGCGQSQEGNDVKLSDQNNVSNTMAAQSKQFKDALEILGSNNELFVKLLQKPNPHIAGSIQKHENSKVAAGLEPNKIHGQTIGGNGSSRQHPLATKEQAKERKYMFFWRKGKSNRRQMLEATDTAQTVSKIVILKPNPERGINQKAATARTLHQQPCTSHAAECSGRENSKFSIKEVKKRFKFVTGESRRERNLAPAEDLQGDPRKLKDSAIAVNKDFRHLPEGSLANKPVSDFKNDIKPFISSKQKQQNGTISEISGHIVAPKGASIFYEEAKRHLTEMLKNNDCSVNYPAVQISKSLEGILSLPHGNMSTPRSNLRGKDYLDPSPGETGVYVACEVEREECTQERSQSQEDLGSIACCTSAAVDDQVEAREGYDGYDTNEAQEGPRHAHDEPGTLSNEGIDKFICGENICNKQSIPGEQSRDDVCQEILEEIKQGKEHVKMSPTSADGIVEILGQQEPETPEPRASTKLISDGSPEQSDENQERPSPVSVLEPFFEDIGSPDCITKKECELHGLQRTLYFPDNEPGVHVLWEDKSVRVDYIKLVLELSELCAEQNLEVWYLEDELISPCLFEELQSQGDQTDDLKLLFDCICEALTEIQERYFRLSSWLTFLKHDIRTPPVGENLITEVDRYVYRYIQYSLPSTLEEIIKRDLEVETWMNIRSETEGIVMEIWEFVLDELIDETVFDLWI